MQREHLVVHVVTLPVFLSRSLHYLNIYVNLCYISFYINKLIINISNYLNFGFIMLTKLACMYTEPQ